MLDGDKRCVLGGGAVESGMLRVCWGNMLYLQQEDKGRQD